MDTVDALILDLLDWVALRPRTYPEVMAAWRTTCPKLPVWEDATDRGFVTIVQEQDREMVRLTSAGRSLLEDRRSRLVRSQESELLEP